MSKSEQLRELHIGTIKNKESKKDDKLLYAVNEDVLHELKTQYSLPFIHVPQWQTKKILSPINARLEALGIECDDLDCGASHIRPDGGFLVLQHGKSSHVLCISEAKKQGTNDLRASEGKSKQSSGNVVERASKNLKAADQLLFFEMIFPYLLFAHGCDFVRGSSIKDRLRFNLPTGWGHDNFNKIQMTDICETLAMPTAFAQLNTFTRDFLYRAVMRMATMSLSYYVDKYDIPMETNARNRLQEQLSYQTSVDLHREQKKAAAVHWKDNNRDHQRTESNYACAV